MVRVIDLLDRLKDKHHRRSEDHSRKHAVHDHGEAAVVVLKRFMDESIKPSRLGGDDEA